MTLVLLTYMRAQNQSDKLEDSTFESESHAPSEASCMVEDLKWASVIRKLPAYYAEDLSLEGATNQEHVSFVSAALYKSKKGSAIPSLPLDGTINKKSSKFKMTPYF